MRWLDGVLLAFGVLNIFAGAEAYFAKGSLPSLLGGGLAGIVVIAGAALAKSHPTAGYAVAALGTLAVGGRMLGTYLSKHTVWPGLVFTVLSAAVLVCLVVGYFAAKKAA